jgi:predicted nucleotidyltransferase
MDKSKTNKIPTLTLEEMVTRIVAHFHPQQLILFGSHARGEAREDSDFDLLIIAPSSEPRWRRTVPVYRLLAGLGVPKDICMVDARRDRRVARCDIASHPQSSAGREGAL